MKTALALCSVVLFGSSIAAANNLKMKMDGQEVMPNVTIEGGGEPAAKGVQIDNYNLALKYSGNTSPRVYLAADRKYQKYKLMNKELVFDVDVSTLECGMNGALYFVSMPEDVPASGSGYCDAWSKPACAEFDVWEANKISNQITSHGAEGTNVDGPGCGVNPYTPDKKHYGPGGDFDVDTTKAFTVVTQFISDNNAETGNLKIVQRQYYQNGKKVESSSLNCAEKFNAMSKSIKDGMVLAASIWADETNKDKMLWLDGRDMKKGTCDNNVDLGALKAKGSTITFSNIRVANIGSTNAGNYLMNTNNGGNAQQQDNKPSSPVPTPTGPGTVSPPHTL